MKKIADLRGCDAWVMALQPSRSGSVSCLCTNVAIVSVKLRSEE